MTAGDSHTMHCTVSDIPYLAVSPTIELIGPGDIVLVTNMSLTVTHTLDPVMTSHAGQYTCRASVIIASVSVDISGQSTSTLTVQSKLTFTNAGTAYYRAIIFHQSQFLLHPSLSVALTLCMLELHSV